MGELGPQAEDLHRQLGYDIARQPIDCVWAVGPMSSLAARTVQEKSEHPVKISCYPNTDSACVGVEADIKEGDLILIKGSRAAGLEQIVTQLTNNQQPATNNQ